jgi:4-amino-4-deoxy-L-arabinose transferase-like glycosyltransferase
MNKAQAPRWPFFVASMATLLVAAGLRLYRLPGLPLGFHYDEAANGILAGEIVRGATAPVFIPSYTGKEVLFFYWTALLMKLLGATPLALRLSAVLAGLATVAATIWAVRELLGGQRSADWVALLAAGFLATSFWHLILSRYGFRAVSQPLLQALTVAALWRGLRRSPLPFLPDRGREGLGEGAGGGLLYFLLAGLFCGLTAYTYLAARAFPIPLAAALLSLLLADRSHRRMRLGQLALFAAVAAVALAPLARYWLIHPGSFMNRTQQVAAESWAEAWAGICACLAMLFLRGDPYVRFNAPGRPVFDSITATLFLLGLATVVWQLVRLLRYRSRSLASLHFASHIFLLTYFPTMLLPSALATGEIIPSNLRAAGLLPFVYVFPALGLWSILGAVRRFLLSKSLPVKHPLLLSVFCILLLAPGGLGTASAYFQWASSAELYYAADGDLADVAAYLNRADLTDTTPYVASIHYRHPTLAFLAEDYERIKWLTGGRTIAIPARGEALLIFPRSASEDLGWVQSLLLEDTLVAALSGPDDAPAFHAYRAGPTLDVAPTHPLTANLGHVALLLGYDVIGEPRSGDSAEVAVWWRVLNRPGEGNFGPVARLTDPWGFVWGETLPFHYPSEQWEPGELVVDHLSIPVAPGVPPGDYAVRFSLYSDQGDSLLSVLDDAGRYAGTYVELPVHLARASMPVASEALDIHTRLDVRTDGLTLLGINLDKTTARPGEQLYLTLYWRADESPLPDHEITVSLGDTPLYADAPVHGTYPTSAWTAGEIVTDRYDPRLPRDVPPRDYSLQLQVSNLSLNLGTVTVQAVERTFDVPSISQPLTAALGEQVELLGYDLSAETCAAGDTLTLTLYWRALAEMDASYTVFVHLLAPDGSMTGQRDSPPLGGAYPTDLWLPGEVVTDVYEISISADPTPGEHRLEVGMYVAETGVRLPVADGSNDAIPIQVVTVAK